MQKTAVAADATLRADGPAGEKIGSLNKEMRRAVPYTVMAPAADGGLVKSVYIGAAPAVKTVVVSTPTAAAPAQDAVQATANATVTTVANNPSVIVQKPVYPRWHFRKRFWTGPRKAIYVAPAVTADTESSPSNIVAGLFAVNAVGDGGAVAGKTDASGSLFDDIFNIPISTLAAVNQLLRNNIG